MLVNIFLLILAFAVFYILSNYGLIYGVVTLAIGIYIYYILSFKLRRKKKKKDVEHLITTPIRGSAQSSGSNVKVAVPKANGYSQNEWDDLVRDIAYKMPLSDSDDLYTLIYDEKRDTCVYERVGGFSAQSYTLLSAHILFIFKSNKIIIRGIQRITNEIKTEVTIEHQIQFLKNWNDDDKKKLAEDIYKCKYDDTYKTFYGRQFSVIRPENITIEDVFD